jgi:hypothetical protein
VPARRALRAVLDLWPDLIGLQEWYPARFPILAGTGRVGLVPHLGVRSPRRAATAGTPTYLWNTPLLGGCAVGARADRFELLRSRTRLLSRPGLADREPHRLTLEPGRAATVAVYRDLLVDRTVCLVNFHLVSGVQAGGCYRSDRPVLAERHRHEHQRLELLVREHLAAGHVVHATGDSNFDGLHIDRLTSAWEGREAHTGTLGPRRKVDDILGPGPAEAVMTITTASDHRAVIARRLETTP